MWRAVCFCCLVLGVTLLDVPSARCVEAPLADTSQTLLSYGETYVSRDGGTARHSGLDLASEPGSRVYSVTDGVIVFAGSVPSAGGGTHLAITVETSDGDKWSYVPVESSVVSVGDVVHAGQQLGFLAACGDASAQQTHLHIGLRVSGTYCDPSELMPVSAIAGQEPQPIDDVPSDVILDSAASPLQVGVPEPVLTPSGSGVSCPQAQPLPVLSSPVVHVESVALDAVSPASDPSPSLIQEGGIVQSTTQRARLTRSSAAVSPIPAQAASRLAPALVAVAGLFMGFMKRPRSCCVTAPGDTVAAVVGR